jgi:quinoprotein glucose dehydrogenase
MVNPGASAAAPYIGAPRPIETLDGVPLWKPPYGRITALDLNTGNHRWMVPMGNFTHPRLQSLSLPSVGRATRGHALLTKTLLIIGQEGTTQRAEGRAAMAAAFEVHDATLRAYDKAIGKVVGEVTLPRNVTAAPMTYMLNGDQFVVVTTGGDNLPAELIALRLP